MTQKRTADNGSFNNNGCIATELIINFQKYTCYNQKEAC